MNKKIIAGLAAAPLALGMSFFATPSAHAAAQTLAMSSSSDGTNLTITVTGCDSTLNNTDRAVSLSVGSNVVNAKPGATETITLPLKNYKGKTSYVVTCNYYNAPAQQLSGEFGQGMVDGVLYTDVNGNGSYDEGTDTPIANGSLDLYDMNGKLVAHGASDDNGDFSLGPVADGVYAMKATFPSGEVKWYTATVKNGLSTITAGAPAMPGNPGTPTNPSGPGLSDTGVVA